MSRMLVVVLVLELRCWVVVDGRGAVVVPEMGRRDLWSARARTVERSMKLPWGSRRPLEGAEQQDDVCPVG